MYLSPSVRHFINIASLHPGVKWVPRRIASVSKMVPSCKAPQGMEDVHRSRQA